MANRCRAQRDPFWSATIAAILRTAIKSPAGARSRHFCRKISCACGEMLGMLLFARYIIS